MWSGWGLAETCLAGCGDGVAVRRRHCDSPLTQNGGRVCARDEDGTYDIMYQACNVRQCEDGEFFPNGQQTKANEEVA